MRTLVLGGTGMLGRAVVAHGRRRGWSVLGLGRDRCDITDRDAVASWVRTFQPAVLINCAAYTKVDDCESNKTLANQINGDAIGHLVEIGAEHDARLIQVSTDYVFAGDEAGAAESERAPLAVDAPTGPISAYGRSKLLGEQAALADERSLVVRTSWLFGPGGPNFVATMRRLMLAGKPLSVVDDQIGRPTYTPFLARALVDLAAAGTTGVVHYGNREATSWHGFAEAIARVVAPGTDVRPVPTSQFPRPAPRPAWSVLDVSSFEDATGRAVEPWAGGLATYLEILGGSAS